jgi:hypothetical protein
MQRFACSNCKHEVYFDNIACERCGLALGFDPVTRTMLAIVPTGAGKLYEPRGASEREHVRYCANQVEAVCNWLVPAKSPEDTRCIACAMNRTIPDLSIPANLPAWGRLERAKKRLVYGLMRLGLPLKAPQGDLPPLAFEFIAGATTGHENGLITINIAETDAVERERQRTALDEPYRSLLGHMRHESGHYYWMLLVEHGPLLGEFRKLFGDETADYAQALARHHATGAPADWVDRHVTAYASSHPWEDWAESWAHYLHIVDVLDTALARGTYLADWAGIDRPGRFDPYQARGIGHLTEMWFPLTLTLNALNRSMGHRDFYPFVLSQTAIAKLGFVHKVVATSRSAERVRRTQAPAAAAQ